MLNDPDWVSTADLIALNELVVAQTGEPFAVRDHGLVDSAAHRPRNAWVYGGERDIATLAVLLMIGVCRNHGFEQGNKRTGLLAADYLLRLNGHQLAIADEETFALAIIAVVEGRCDEAWLADLIRPWVVPC